MLTPDGATPPSSDADGERHGQLPDHAPTGSRATGPALAFSAHPSTATGHPDATGQTLTPTHPRRPVTRRLLLLAASALLVLMSWVVVSRLAEWWDGLTPVREFTFLINPEVSPSKSARRFEGMVCSVAWSPDGRRIATGCGGKESNKEGKAEGWAQVCHAQTGEKVLSLVGHTDSVYSIAFSPDGTRIATGSQDKTAKVWVSRTGQEILTLTAIGSNYVVRSVTWSPDGKYIAVGSENWSHIEKGGVVKVHDARSGHEIISIKTTIYAPIVAFSPDGKRILSSELRGRGSQVLDARTGREVLTVGETPAAWSPDGKRIVTAQDSTVKVWDALTGQQILTPIGGPPRFAYRVAYSPDGKRIASAGNGWISRENWGEPRTAWPGVAKVWDAETGQEIRSLEGHIDSVFCLAWSPDGRRIATGSGQGEVKVWDGRKRQ